MEIFNFSLAASNPVTIGSGRRDPRRLERADEPAGIVLFSSFAEAASRRRRGAAFIVGQPILAAAAFQAAFRGAQRFRGRPE